MVTTGFRGVGFDLTVMEGGASPPILDLTVLPLSQNKRKRKRPSSMFYAGITLLCGTTTPNCRPRPPFLHAGVVASPLRSLLVGHRTLATPAARLAGPCHALPPQAVPAAPRAMPPPHAATPATRAASPPRAVISFSHCGGGRGSEGSHDSLCQGWSRRGAQTRGVEPLPDGGE